ncbi:RimK family alpha-L-glutamate ligase [Noviherbaspirillum sp. CPCC 100848]|uniref:RimK family alpha-L-glutamate ligase n=1 Tax=Noviherbaspirillum album TaxID=3080276 RepID=A0ABU6JDS1_9BURK|nr:RimK family alpha-L-glutamate ligase [Noviherbaspirillum sp. CPCC 100848]MEC4721789.1 RimK family alpha-L-glutamate ligase [Noviherbaspirillum sp. CPCC 100848]
MNHNTAMPPSENQATSPFIGLAPLMRQAFSGVDLKPLGTSLIEQSTRRPDDAHAMMDLATVLQLTGNRDIAMAMQAQALQLQQVYRIPASTPIPAIRLLALMAPGDLMANTPLEFLIEQSDIQLDMLYLTPGMEGLSELPDHDVMFVAIGESDENRPLLEQLASVASTWPRPVLNRPERIANLSRDRACALLKDAAGVAMPQSLRVSRDKLEAIAEAKMPLQQLLEDAQFPIIVRPVGSHAGHGLDKIESVEQAARYLEAHQNAEFYIARFVDYRSADGQFRKYRIILIDGKPYVSHMAISSHWMIHYLNAGMTDSQEKRNEEERFMAGFDDGFAVRHAQAFQSISENLGLDYVGLDCGEAVDGRLLIFEADSDMIVHAMDPVDMFPYKQPQMHKLFAAFRRMLVDAAAGGAA